MSGYIFNSTGGIDIEVEADNVDAITKALNEAYVKGLEGVGLAAEGYAKQKITEVGAVDTGNLRNSITHSVNDAQLEVYIGTNVEYGKYVECGTGMQSTVGGNPLLAGMKARPFLKPAATDHKPTYDQIMQDALKNG